MKDCAQRWRCRPSREGQALREGQVLSGAAVRLASHGQSWWGRSGGEENGGGDVGGAARGEARAMVVVAEAECRDIRASVGQRIWSKVRDTCKRAKQQADLTGSARQV